MPNPPRKITVLLADDHPVTRAGIRTILQEAPDIQIVAEADNGGDTERLVAELCPQILLLDLKMPGTSPTKLEKRLRTNCPETITLVLTAHDRDAYLAGMMDAGVAGFIAKTEGGEQLIAAIRRTAQGEFLFDSEQLARAQRWREEAGNRWKGLSDRERKILRLLTDGLDNKTIAMQLSVSPKTIAWHVTTILEKLRVKSRQEATAWVHKYLPDDLE